MKSHKNQNIISINRGNKSSPLQIQRKVVKFKMRKQTKYFNGEIEMSWLRDKRHTNKPHTKSQWLTYEDYKKRYNTNTLAKKYGVKKRTIYKWNSDLKYIKEKFGL